MQAGRGRSNRNLVCAVGIDRLVTLQVLAAFFRGMTAMNVGRQRHLAEPVGNGDNGFAAGRGKSDAGKAVAFAGAHSGRECPVARKGRTGRQLPRRPEQTPPFVCFPGSPGRARRRPQQETFDASSRRLVRKQTRGQHGGVVADEECRRHGGNPADREKT